MNDVSWGGGALTAMTHKKHITSVIDLQTRLIGVLVCVAWPTCVPKSYRRTWHKHKIVQILAKIVVIVSVFDWVSNLTVPVGPASGKAK